MTRFLSSKTALTLRPAPVATATRLKLAGMVAAGALLLASNSTYALDEGVLATVNGQPISEQLLGVVTQQLKSGGQQIVESEILDELINLEMLRQLAIENGVDKQPDIANVLHLQSTQILANAYMRNLSETMEVSDADMQEEYKTQSERMGVSEFKASHILLETEEAANAIIEELANGADFAELAKEKSTGPSGANGGDLGWFKPESMVAEFSAAVSKMNAGEVSEAPTKTDFGWHVIRLDETRSTPVPPFEEVKEQVRNALLRTKMNDTVAELRDAATVELAE